jgi:hypothetical protein
VYLCNGHFLIFYPFFDLRGVKPVSTTAFGRMGNGGSNKKCPIKREEPVKCGFHRRVMKKSFFVQTSFGVALVYVLSIEERYEKSL